MNFVQKKWAPRNGSLIWLAFDRRWRTLTGLVGNSRLTAKSVRAEEGSYNLITPTRIINSVAPMRICDNGGWTDTWFAKYGRVFNIAVYPYAEVQVKVFEGDVGGSRASGRSSIRIHAENYGDHYEISGYAADKPGGVYDKHPLLEAALDFMVIPAGLSMDVTIFSEAPGGCSTGTSAAVSVALIGALDYLTPGRWTPYEVAVAAHRIETELLKQECGVQDQLAAAFGGINLIEMHQFPHAAVSPIHIADNVWWELESRLALVYVGRPHSSSAVHKLVIAELESAGPDAPKLNALRRTPELSRDAIYAADFSALGRAMVENTRAQSELHPALVGPFHQRVIEIARSHGAVGWKVNGAGGDGGSVTILCQPDPAAKRTMLREIEQSDPSFRNIPIYLSRQGLRRWESRIN